LASLVPVEELVAEALASLLQLALVSQGQAEELVVPASPQLPVLASFPELAEEAADLVTLNSP
jgi:hypothetical protein